MDTTSSIVQQHNPNKEGKHPHLIQKMTHASHMLHGKKSEESTHPHLVPLKDWKPCDLEMFASMGFSGENAGDDGHYMEEDALPSGLDDEKKFTRRVARTKDHPCKWILEKKSMSEPENSYRLEKVYGHLMGTDKNPGLLDYFDTLTNELTENNYLYKSMKLKSILENLPTSKQSPPQSDITPVSPQPVAETTHPEPVPSNEAAPVVQRGLSKAQKKMLQELVFEYNKYNEVLEARKKLMEVAKKVGDIGELSESYLIEKLHEGNKEENAWFEEKTIRRHTNDIKKMTVEFKKMATECEEKMRNMQSLYQECGMMLERYFHME